MGNKDQTMARFYWRKKKFLNIRILLFIFPWISKDAQPEDLSVCVPVCVLELNLCDTSVVYGRP